MKRIPPYLFSDLDRIKKTYKGTLLDFGVGDPIDPPPETLLNQLKNLVNESQIHTYPNYDGEVYLKDIIIEWYNERFDVRLERDEIAILIGSKEGISHFIWAFTEKNDKCGYVDPSYPVYLNNLLMTQAKPYPIKLVPEKEFLFNIENIPEIKYLILNYPSNPTGGVADYDFYERLVNWAIKNDTFLVNDNCYSEIYTDLKPPSILSVKNAKKVAIEFHSFSKMLNITGWRLGFVVGNKNVINEFITFKKNIDSGPFKLLQMAISKVFLNIINDFTLSMRKKYIERGKKLTRFINKIGLNSKLPKGTFYIWTNVNKDDRLFVKELIEKWGILATPGQGFGKYGKDFIRFSLTVDDNTIESLSERLK